MVSIMSSNKRAKEIVALPKNQRERECPKCNTTDRVISARTYGFYKCKKCNYVFHQDDEAVTEETNE